MRAAFRRYPACHVAFRDTSRNDEGFRVESTMIPEM